MEYVQLCISARTHACAYEGTHQAVTSLYLCVQTIPTKVRRMHRALPMLERLAQSSTVNKALSQMYLAWVDECPCQKMS